MRLRYFDFKKLDYPNDTPIEAVLADLMFKKKLDFHIVTESYIAALNKERHIKDILFNESAIAITQILGDGFRGKHRLKAIKRAIHVYNLNKTMVPHAHDCKYDYTEEDKKELDELMETIYGINMEDLA